ncbi:hypothetical protein VKS41_002868 [Umbelopsis sp. WA50703]
MSPTVSVSSSGIPVSTKSHSGAGANNQNAVSVDLVSKSHYHNEGTAMHHTTRKALGVHGLAPSRIESLEIQKRRAMVQLRSKQSMIEKYIFMAQMRNTNIRLFYKIVCDELEELAPVIYTPTVGHACVEWSNIYPFLAPPGTPDGLYLTQADLPNIKELIRTYQPFPTDPHPFSPEIAVISDGSRILGLGDLGVNGMGIPIGKLQLYVAGAGIDPRRTLPIMLDLGTNNDKFLEDDFYLGVRNKRPNDDVFYDAVDQVLSALYSEFPELLVQFEDWSSEHAFGLLEKYQHKTFCFNDDIQGTGAVILSGLMNAYKIVANEDKVSAKDHRIVFFGAGSAGIGVAKQIKDYFVIEHGFTEEEARKVFYIVDSKGLITNDRGDRLAEHKKYFSRDDNNGQQFKDLLDIINYVKPTTLIGLSSQPQTFTEPILRRMAELNKQPVVFPLSNPSTQAECTFAQAMEFTENRVLFASGTAFPTYTITETGAVKIPGQGNNFYIFPGLGLGASIAKPAHITDNMVYQSAAALADCLTPEEKGERRLYPNLKRIRQISAEVAAAVCIEAVKEGLARNPEIESVVKDRDQLIKYVMERMWTPESDGYGAEKSISKI